MSHGDIARIICSAKEGYAPFIAHSTDAGMDLKFCPSEKQSHIDPVIIAPQDTAMLGTGCRFALDRNYWLQLETRSSMAKRGIMVLGGIIDSDYRGEVKVLVHNGSDTPYTIAPGERIAQAVLRENIARDITVISDEDFESHYGDTDRGDKGFGSSGA